jgi:predicted DNA-binding transcriptional regulator YafY
MPATSARLLRLLALLQSQRDWSGETLADRLGVTTRTVRRDIDRLRELGYPVHGTKGTDGGYRLGAGAALPPLLLDDDEAVAVAVGLQNVAGGSILGSEESALRALTKLEQVLPSRLRRRIQALHAYTVPVSLSRQRASINPNLLTALAAACRDREQLRLDYRDFNDAITRRTIEPHRLVNWGRRWYLVAWDVDRRDWRTFRVDRVSLRSPNGPRFAPRELPEQDLAAYVSRRVSAAAWRVTASFIVLAPADEVVNRINPSVGSVEPIDERSCVLHTGADTVETIAVYIGMLGVDFSVTSPPELVSYMRELSARYLRATADA